ncbi:MAG: hypothetical protein JXR36_17060, partial [Bacteroidales bacterium]|nr:hypothetical protein [Bacteroidales bacterium]
IQKSKLFVFIALSCIIISGFLLQSCEEEDILEMNHKVTKDEVINLANKYGLPIEFTEEISAQNTSTHSLQELDRIFASYKESREKAFENKFIMIQKKDEFVFQTIRKENRNLGSIRLKSGDVEGGMWSEDAWYYDLTWLDVDVSWQDTGDALNINISSSYNGVSIYEYAQDNFTYSTSGDTIFFDVTGNQSMTIGFENFGIHFTDDVNASGWVNTSTGEGVLTIDKSDYWF